MIIYNLDIGEIILFIVEVFLEDEGEYVCVVYNLVGEVSIRMYFSVFDLGVVDEEVYEEIFMEMD